jgi:hypothetical protein
VPPPSDEAHLDETAWARAKAGAAGVYRSPAFGIAVAIVELLALPAAVLFTADPGTSTQAQVAVPLLSGAIALVMAFLVVLAVQLASAPVAQRNEARARARQLALEAATQATDPGVLEKERERKSELRVAIARISEELEHTRSVLGSSNRAFFIDYRLATVRWEEYGSELADRGYLDAHKAARKAYRLIDEVNRSASREWDSYGDVAGATIDETKANQARNAISPALAALEGIPVGSGN